MSHDSERSRPEEDSSAKWTFALIAGFVALCVAILGIVAAVLVGGREDTPFDPDDTSGATLTIGSIAEPLASAKAADAVVGTVQVKGDEYVPTSEWHEEGADSDVTTLGFAKGEPAPEQGKQGHLDEADIQSTIATHQQALIQCYIEGLEQNPDLSGRVDFHFRIAPDGHVAMIKVTQSQLRDHATEDCFVDAIRTWNFPNTARGMTKFDTNLNFAFE